MRYDTSIDRPDQPAFDALVRCAAPSALRLATVVLGTRDGADDVVQVAMTRAWSAFGRYDPDRPFMPWFLRIVANTARNDRRRRGRQATLRRRAGAPGAEQSAEDDVMAVLDRARVLAALNELGRRGPDGHRAALLRAARRGEMAEVLDCPRAR